MKRLFIGHTAKPVESTITSTAIPNELKCVYDIEDIVYAINNQNQQDSELKLLELLNNRTDLVNYTLNCIINAATKAPKYIFDLISIFENICKAYNSKKKLEIDPLLIPEKDSVWENILYDDVDKLQVKIAIPEFDFNQRNRADQTLIDYSASCGSIQCFKILLLHNCRVGRRTAEGAIHSGNYEIIRILEQKSIKFDNCLGIALENRRNDIADWLYENYPVERVTISECIQYNNLQAFSFYLKNDYSLIETYNSYSCLGISVETENIDLIKFILPKGVEINLGKISGGIQYYF